MSDTLAGMCLDCVQCLLDDLEMWQSGRVFDEPM